MKIINNKTNQLFNMIDFLEGSKIEKSLIIIKFFDSFRL